MKKLLLPLLLAVAMTITACGGKGSDKSEPTASPKASPTGSPAASASAVPAEATGGSSSGDNPNSTIDTGSTNIERMSPEQVANETIDDGKAENAFIGQWRAVGTTSENAAFTSLELTITEDGYTVVMSFSNYSGTTEYAGEYELTDGVLVFDENFIDCSAYFYEGDADTLVIDNGTSLVFCTHLEQEREMR